MKRKKYSPLDTLALSALSLFPFPYVPPKPPEPPKAVKCRLKDCAQIAPDDKDYCCAAHCKLDRERRKNNISPYPELKK